MPEESTTLDVVELTRRAVEAMCIGDIDGAASAWALDAVWDLSPMDMGVLEGRSAIRRFLEDWWVAYEALAVELEELLDLGNGVVFMAYVQRGRSAGSEAEVYQRSARVSLMVDGLVERATGYWDIDEARAAAERLAQERADG